MKIDRIGSKFRPVYLCLESKEEVEMLCTALTESEDLLHPNSVDSTMYTDFVVNLMVDLKEIFDKE